jgi:TolB protein
LSVVRHTRVAGWALALAAAPLAAQDTTQVRIGLTYQSAAPPTVVVVPVGGIAGDSARAIIARDLEYGDRMRVTTGPGAVAYEAALGQDGRAPNYPLWQRLGAAGVVHADLLPNGIRVRLHDVQGQRLATARDFPLAGGPLSREWRMSLHGVSDEIERWITGTRGIAQTRVAFVRGGRVFVVDSDGAMEEAVTAGGGALSPSWHPAGHAVAFSTFGEHGSEIRVVDLRTNRERRLSGAARGLNITPEWTPGGDSIVFAHGRESGTDLFVVSAEGGEPRRITVGRGTDNTSPSISPDGRRIAFTSGRSGHPEVYTVDLDGANAELLTPFTIGEQSYRASPSWSPDGRLVAFQARVAGRFQIMTINLRDRSMRQLTSEGVNEDPSWAPDGRHLVFTSSRSGTRQLWVLDVETGRARQLTRQGGSRLAAWSRILPPTS